MGDFEVELHAQELAAEVVESRQEAAAADEQIAAVLQPRFDGHLTVCQTAIDALIDAHRQIVERTDIDLDAETRPLAVWELAGRCLALANALLDQFRLGYGPETVGTMRVLHEAANLLMVAVDEEEGELSRRWLRGQQVEQRQAREALGEIQERVAGLAAEQGLEIEGDIEELTRALYGVLSRGAHNNRTGFTDSISRLGRLFVYGPHPSPLVRAVYVDYGGELIEQIVLEVGHALARFWGRGWFADTVRPLVAALHAVREDLPINAPVREQYGYPAAPEQN